MFQIKLINLTNKFVFLLKNNKDVVGRISFIYHSNKTLIIDCYIVPQYRRKWLTKHFSIRLFKLAIAVSKKYNYNMWITSIDNKLSIKIVEYFNFVKYNNMLYYLKF